MNVPPPQPIPLTIAGCLVRFIIQGINVPLILSYGEYRRYNTPIRDVFPSPLPRFKFPTLEQRSVVVDTLQEEASVRAVHFIPPSVIVELSVIDGRKYERRTLPAKAGGLQIMYHHAEKGFWPNYHDFGSAALKDLPTPVNYSTNLIDDEPSKPSPGVGVSSALNSNGTAPMATAAGIVLQRDNERRLTLSTDAFQQSDESYDPKPTSSQRIGHIRRYVASHNLALVELDSYRNRSRQLVPRPWKIRVED